MLPFLGRLRLTPTAMLEEANGEGEEGEESSGSEPYDIQLPGSPESPQSPPTLTRRPLSPHPGEDAADNEGGEGGEDAAEDEGDEGGEDAADDEDDEDGEDDEDDEDDDADDADDSMPALQVAANDAMAGARRRYLPGDQDTTQAKKRKMKENAQNGPRFKEFLAAFEDDVNNLDKMLLVGGASAERVRKEIRELVFRMAVWFSSRPGDAMRDIYGNDGALLKYRSIVKELIKRAKEFELNDEADLLHRNLMLGVLQVRNARHGRQKEEAWLRLNHLMAYARADTKAKQQKVNAEEEAARKAKRAARAAAGAGSSNDPAPEVPTTADEELAANRKALKEYATQGPPLPAPPMTLAELLEKHKQDLRNADAQLEKIIAYNKKFANTHPLEKSEMEGNYQYYKLKVVERMLLVAKEALRILQLTHPNDHVAINQAHREISDLGLLQVTYQA